jgi:hypothetical protein
VFGWLAAAGVAGGLDLSAGFREVIGVLPEGAIMENASAMAGPLCVASLDDGPAGVAVARLPFALPVASAGLVIRRPGSAGSADGGGRLEFVEVERTELVRAGLGMARSSLVAAVVVCPAGVSPGRTALAVAVADSLRERRGDGRRVVTCGVCPILGVGRSAIPHEVQVSAGGAVQVRLVWEVLSWADLGAWRAGLSRRAVVA